MADAEGPAASREPTPEVAGSQNMDGDNQDFVTKEESAGTMGTEESAWIVAEETLELRSLSSVPEFAEDWAWFENILE